MNRQAVIFDVDGVLVDSYRAHFESWAQLYAEIGHAYTEEAFAADFGRTSRDILHRSLGGGGHSRGIAMELTGERIAQLDERKEWLYREIVRQQFPAMAGAAELIAALAADGFLLAVGSSGPTENVELALEQLGSAGHFSAAVTGRDVMRGKPDPQVFQLAAERLGVPPARCAVVEDASHGVAAAKGAGMKCVALVGTATRQELASADLVVERLDELSPGVFRRLIGG